MRTNVAQLAVRPRLGRPTPEPAVLVQGGAVPPLAAARLARPSLQIIGFVVYLWVLHSQKLPIAQPAILVGLLGVLLQQGRIRLSPPLIWFAAFILWGSIGSLSSPFQTDLLRDNLHPVLDYVKLWLIFLLALNVAHSRAQLRTVAVAWLAIYALYPIRGTLFNVTFGIADAGRFAWNFIFENPNDLATLTLPMLGMTIALLQTERQKWFRLATLTGAFLLPVIIIFTQSRGGILALATFGALLFLSNRKKGRALIMGLLAAGFILAVAPSSVWERLGGLRAATGAENLAAVDREGSADQRFEIWKVAAAIAADYPVTGTGFGTYKFAHYKYAPNSQFRPTARGYRDTHSTYLNVLAETGVVGLLLFLGMLTSIVFPVLRKAQSLRRTEPLAARQLLVLVFGLFAFLQACVFATMSHIPFLYLYAAVLTTAAALLQEGPPGSFGVRGGARAFPPMGRQ